MANKIQLRRDVANVWGSVNPILSQGEMGVEVDTGRFKFGDGVTRWVNLRYSPFDFTTSNVTEGPVNLYFTPVRAVDANAPKFTTANVTELTNLYFTNTRVIAALSAGNNINLSANGQISTSDANVLINNGYKLELAVDGKLTAPGEVYGQYFTVRGGGAANAEIGSLGYGGDTIYLNGIEGVNIVTGPGEGGPAWQFTANGILTLPAGGDIKTSTGNSILPVPLTSSAIANLLVAGNQITIEANGRISSNPPALTGSDVANVLTSGNQITIEANGRISSNPVPLTSSAVANLLVAGNQITIEANGRISANVSVTAVRGLQKVTTTSSSIDLNTTKYVFVDPNAAGGNVNITLNNPQDGYDITVKNLNDGGSGVYTVTVITSSTAELLTGGFNSSAVLSNSGTTGTWVYDSSTPAFRLISKLV